MNEDEIPPLIAPTPKDNHNLETPSTIKDGIPPLITSKTEKSETLEIASVDQ